MEKLWTSREGDMIKNGVIRVTILNVYIRSMEYEIVGNLINIIIII